MNLQIPRRALRNVLPLRRQSHWLRLRRCSSRTAKRIPQVSYAQGSRASGAQDAEAGHGGEAGLEECAVG
jgi:hypothetical protein